MINFRFRVIRSTPRFILHLEVIGEYLRVLEHNARPVNPRIRAARVQLTLPAGCVPPPTDEATVLTIREVKPPKEEVKLAFRAYVSPTRMVRVNIFQEGKINVLGAPSFEAGRRIYAWLEAVFTTNWARFVRLRPLPDARPRAARAVVRPAARVPLAPPVFDLTDGDMDEIMGNLEDGAGAGKPTLASEVARLAAEFDDEGSDADDKKPGDAAPEDAPPDDATFDLSGALLE